eukprot:CAMPEP_0115705068 /NCGR_PEP_ID=MMETSP0272-20121206/70015_1 /TAXON_ID=71861 /ORGANISM="Scrippsiella trochoidea, Strain CCMP3099" /LENGTH=146 /DNA_ID=CAMNT_0003146135 /DNA_START=41 /DNA_END=478 /DNA_ORIENTATION=+
MSATCAESTWGGGQIATGGCAPSEPRREKWPQRSPAVLQTFTSFVASVLTSADGALTGTSESTAVKCAGHAPTTRKASGWALMLCRGFESTGPWSSKLARRSIMRWWPPCPAGSLSDVRRWPMFHPLAAARRCGRARRDGVQDHGH